MPPNNLKYLTPIKGVQSTGFKLGATAGNVDIGGEQWINPNNVLNNLDTSFAVNSLPSQTASSLNWLVASGNFTLASIPPDSIVKGVEARVRLRWFNSSDFKMAVQLYNGLPIGSPKNVTSLSAGPADTTNSLIFGSPTDLWGTSITPAIVNGTTFGMLFSAFTSNQSGSAGTTFQVISLELKVYYL